MKCACESEYSFPCQFPEETEFFSFGTGDWCRFHLPLQDVNGIKSPKGRGDSEWEEGGAERAKFEAEVHARLRAGAPWKVYSDPDPRANLRGVAFPPRFNFTLVAPTLHVNFTHGTFGDWTSFEGAKFGDEARFGSAKFGSGASFIGAKFGGVALFDGVSFGSGASFIGAKFGGVALFDGVSFGDAARFDSATFGDWASFEGAKFGDEARFGSAKFGSGASFFGAKFGGVARFADATFGDEARFEGAKFGHMARFADAKFGGGAGFEGATFGFGADFDGATFGDWASFVKATFHGYANFLAGGENDSRRDFRRIDFSNATFNGPCKFDNRIFGTDTNFNGAVFHDLVTFHGCAFHPGMSFHLTKFLKTKEDKLNTKKENDDATERLERSYRTLKLEMEKLRARNEEADFFALEMECRRQRCSVPPFERFAATLYKHLSDYGRSVDLPLIMLLVLAYAAHYLYLGVAMIGCNPGPGARLAFTLEQMFRPFFVWAKSAPGTGNCLVENSPLLIPVLASLQSLGAIGLLTLFLLALRRRFKMD